jgi:2-C-methyl-D-erythritol 2,4-cyclodiphosphate synthase
VIHPFRVGTGFDVHRFAPDRKLVLGGVDIPHPFGLAGHSDADVLIHAIIDAILGAANLGDIGILFPDSENVFKDISSLILLEKTAKLLRENNFSLVNCDSTIICEQPKIMPYRKHMAENIARALGVSPIYISVKATTTEKLGFTGRREGIAAQAVCMIAL